ncbi:VWFA and cache domain-containing protein 1-like, partial [Saccoglossus kowalevskii]
MILFLTDGKPEDDVSGYSEESEEKEIARNADILRTIITRNRGMNNKVILFTYGLGTEVDMDLLEAMASQNGSAYGVDTSVDIQETVGQAILVDNPENLRSKMASYYDHYANPQIDVPTFSVPHQGASGIGLLTVVSLPVIHNNNFEGIVGIGITLEDLFSDVTYFRQGELSYSFIFEVSSKFVGRTLLHPLLPAPNTVDEDPVFVHITSLERSNEFRTLLNHAIIDGDNFAETTAFVSKRPIARGDSATEGVRVVDEPSQYFCKAVGDGIPYVICVVIADRDKQTKLDAQTPTGSDFMYHRIDISHPDSVCRNGKRKATTDHSTVKFSPNAFIEPKKYASGKETSALVEHYTEYMNDVTEIITSNVLKENIRDTVVATAKIEDIWKEASRSEANQYIAAYFMGTDNGVFRLYPGERLDVHYDHTTRPWYKRVKGNVGKNVLSVPYKDAFGNGYIITLSRTVTV